MSKNIPIIMSKVGGSPGELNRTINVAYSKVRLTIKPPIKISIGIHLTLLKVNLY